MARTAAMAPIAVVFGDTKNDIEWNLFLLVGIPKSKVLGQISWNLFRMLPTDRPLLWCGYCAGSIPIPNWQFMRLKWKTDNGHCWLNITLFPVVLHRRDMPILTIVSRQECVCECDQSGCGINAFYSETQWNLFRLKN